MGEQCNTARSSQHESRVAGLLALAGAKTVAPSLGNEWGLRDPRTVAALHNKAKRYRRHAATIARKHESKSQKMRRVTHGLNRASSVTPTPSLPPMPTPPTSARTSASLPPRSPARSTQSTPRKHSMASSYGHSYTPASTGSEGALLQFSTGQPNLKMLRQSRSRERSRASPKPAPSFNNFMGPSSAVLVVGPGAGAKKKKSRKKAVYDKNGRKVK